MAASTAVYWAGECPTREEVGAVLEDYVRGLGEVEWQRDRWFVDLPGSPSWPFQRAGPATQAQRAAWLEAATGPRGEPWPRWFEVWPAPDGTHLDVLTRQVDDVTSAVALGFAEVCARGWGGEVRRG